MPRYNTTVPQENGAAFVLHDHETKTFCGLRNVFTLHKCHLSLLDPPHIYYHSHDLLFLRAGL